MTDRTGDVGDIGEEAAKLLAAVQGWGRRLFGDAATSHVATGAPECTYCPFCQLIAALRGDRPEVTEKLAEAGGTLLTALRGLLEATHEPADRRVQHIDLDDSDDAYTETGE